MSETVLAADRWGAAVCHLVWLLLPMARHSCYAATWADPKPKASLDYCIPEYMEGALKGSFTAGTALGCGS